MADLVSARSTLLAELREHSLVLGEVTLSGGAKAQYYVDARRAIMRSAIADRSCASSTTM